MKGRLLEIAAELTRGECQHEPSGESPWSCGLCRRQPSQQAMAKALSVAMRGREEAGLTRRAISVEFGCSQSSVSRWLGPKGLPEQADPVSWYSHLNAYRAIVAGAVRGTEEKHGRWSYRTFLVALDLASPAQVGVTVATEWAVRQERLMRHAYVCA